MNRTTRIPTPEQAQHAPDHVLGEAAATGRRPSVLTVARRLGLSNTTFRRHFPDIADEVGEARRTPRTDAAESPAAAEHTRLVARNAKLRRENRLLRDHLDLAVANIQRLTLRAHRLQRELEAAAKVARIDDKTRAR